MLLILPPSPCFFFLLTQLARCFVVNSGSDARKSDALRARRASFCLFRVGFHGEPHSMSPLRCADVPAQAASTRTPGSLPRSPSSVWCAGEGLVRRALCDKRPPNPAPAREGGRETEGERGESAGHIQPGSQPFSHTGPTTTMCPRDTSLFPTRSQGTLNCWDVVWFSDASVMHDLGQRPPVATKSASENSY